MLKPAAFLPTLQVCQTAGQLKDECGLLAGGLGLPTNLQELLPAVTDHLSIILRQLLFPGLLFSIRTNFLILILK